MFVLLTDFGLSDPYQAQLKTVIYRRIPDAIVIDLFTNLNSFDVKGAAYLIPAYVHEFPVTSIFLCVVDPGVGSERRPIMLKLDGQWFVGPDNGLFEILWRRAKEREIYQIDWCPEVLSNSFHGRDLFAPVACELYQKRKPDHSIVERPDSSACEWPEDFFSIIYIDHFGNAISGIRSSSISSKSVLLVNGYELHYVRTFSEAEKNSAFWYCNSNGLIEVFVNQGSAAIALSITCGDSLAIKQ